MAFLTKGILKKDTFKRKTIDIPEWDGQIIVRGLSGHESGRINQGAIDISEMRRKNEVDAAFVERWEAETVAYGWINEDGSNVLDPQDIDDLLGKETKIISLIAKEIRILSGMEKAKDDDPKPADVAKKNLTTTRNGDSGSA